jgi:hypothetical protein
MVKETSTVCVDFDNCAGIDLRGGLLGDWPGYGKPVFVALRKLIFPPGLGSRS